MIELPASPAPNGMEPALLDYGMVQRGASSIRVNRAGNRYRVGFSYPPMQPDKARTFTGRLTRAKRDGVRITLPLIVPQGSPGATVVDGAGQAGTSLAVRGFNAGYPAKEGFWLTVIDADGVGYLHQLTETVRADAGGLATLTIEPPLRAPFADGDTVELAAPWIEGFVDGDEWGWSVPVNRLVSVGFTVEEYS